MGPTLGARKRAAEASGDNDRSVALVLMGHGSRDPEGALELAGLVDAVQARVPESSVWGGVLEFPDVALPSVQTSFDRAVAAGARRILALPLLLSDAGHARFDMPREVADAQARHPSINIRMCPSVGHDPALLEIVEERARSVEGEAPGEPPASALLLVGRGTSHAGANADFFRVGRLLWERNRERYGLVECCFVSLAEPGVPEGLDRCARLGARRVLVVPYFINTGILTKRIPLQVAARAREHPGLRVGVAGHFGVHENLIGIVLARAQAGLADEESGRGRCSARISGTPVDARQAGIAP